MEIILRNKTLSVRAAIMFVLAFALLVLWRSFRRRRGLSERKKKLIREPLLCGLQKQFLLIKEDWLLILP